jgi:hypothetical protein
VGLSGQVIRMHVCASHRKFHAIARDLEGVERCQTLRARRQRAFESLGESAQCGGIPYSVASEWKKLEQDDRGRRERPRAAGNHAHGPADSTPALIK